MGRMWRTVNGVCGGFACTRVVKVHLSFFLPKEMTMTGLNLAKR
jgi:hypothetical protein